jgi:sugar (pentulose or hexulose) kinase
VAADRLRRPAAVPAGAAAHDRRLYGDALLAGIGTGVVDRDARWNPIARVVEPDDDAAVDYERLYRLYRDLYPATRDIAHALAGIGKDLA